MKKMSEVFNGKPCGFSVCMSDEQVRAGQHCINHADSLADALDNLMRSSGGGKKDCGHDFPCTCARDKAKAALSTYRGQQ